MPRVHTATAAKDYPSHDIKKGDTYYHWSFFRGPKQMSKTPPKRSQTTGSGKLSNAYAVEETFEEDVHAAKTLDDIDTALDQAISDIGDVISEFEESAENIRESFSESPQADEAEEAGQNLDDWRAELESIQSDIKSLVWSEILIGPDDEPVEGVDDADFDDLAPAFQEQVMDHVKSMVADNASFPL